MATYNPPSENLPIFDPSVFIISPDGVDTDYLNKNYLRYPTAQGTEHFGDIDVDGTAKINNLEVDGSLTFTGDIDLVGELILTDISGTQDTLKESIINNTNSTVLNFYTNSSASKNNLVQSGDFVMALGPTNTTTGLSIVPVSTNAVGGGIRLTNTSTTIAAPTSIQGNLNAPAGIFTTPSTTDQGALYMLNSNTSPTNYLKYSMNVQAGGYNNIVRAGDTVLVLGPYTTPAPFSIVPWNAAVYKTGLRIQNNQVMLGAGPDNSTVSDPANNIVFNQTAAYLNSSNFYVSNNLLISTLGSYLQFPDGTQQTTAFTATSGSDYTVKYTTNQTVTTPAGCFSIDVMVIGKGGDCGAPNGSSYGGSGSGGNSIAASGIFMGANQTLTLSFSNTSSTGYTNVTYNGNTLARAYNGNFGIASISGGNPGNVNLTAGVGDTTFGTWVNGYGTIGGNGTGTPPDMSPNRGCPKGTLNWAYNINGCAQQTVANAQAPGAVIITFHIGF